MGRGFALIVASVSLLACFNSASVARADVTAVSPEAKALLADVQAAYDKLKSLKVAGTSTTTAERPGRPKPSVMTAEFTGTYLAPNFFKLVTGDTTIGDKKIVMTKGTTSGATGAMVYAYTAENKRYRSREVTAGQKLADREAAMFLGGLNSANNPSLYFASFQVGVQRFAEGSLTERMDVSKGPDVEIAGKKYAAVIRKSEILHETSTLLIDPDTKLVRRLTSVTETPNSGKLTMEVDYTSITPDAELKASDFDWAAPADWQKQ